MKKILFLLLVLSSTQAAWANCISTNGVTYVNEGGQYMVGTDGTTLTRSYGGNLICSNGVIYSPISSTRYSGSNGSILSCY